MSRRLDDGGALYLHMRRRPMFKSSEHVVVMRETAVNAIEDHWKAKCVWCDCVPVPDTHERANIRRTVLDLLGNRRGEMGEWSMAVVLKTTEPETVPGVRIPLPPYQSDGISDSPLAQPNSSSLDSPIPAAISLGGRRDRLRFPVRTPRESCGCSRCSRAGRRRAR
jgi:hypothetical protein